MNLHPWQEVLDRADGIVEKGGTVYQQWLCGHCGMKQTMPDPNAFYIAGICEECKGETDIRTAGHNYMVVTSHPHGLIAKRG